MFYIVVFIKGQFTQVETLSLLHSTRNKIIIKTPELEVLKF